jgi:hypothetical protein
MNANLEQIKTKVDYLLTVDDIRFAANVLRIWEYGEEFRAALDDRALEPQDRLAAALADRQLGQLRFSKQEDWGFWELDESETAWTGRHEWHVIGASELSDTTAILLNAHSGETVFYDHDAMDYGIQDNFIVVKESLAAFVDDVALGSDYRRLYYPRWYFSLWDWGEAVDLEFPSIYGDPWYHLLREMRADLFDGPPVPRSRRQQVNRRIEAYFADEDD